MNKICGYNCEHNKGGQCQITYCDKIGEITTTTQWLSGGRQQGKTYQLIKDQQKEIDRLEKAMEGKTSYKELIIENQSKEIERMKGKLERINCLIHKAINEREINGVGNLNLHEILELSGSDDNE